MSKLSTQAQTIFDNLGEVKVDDELTTTVTNPNAVKEAMLATGISEDQLTSLADVISDSSAAVSAKIGPVMLAHFKEHADVANLDYELEAPLVSLGLSMSRPDGDKPSRKDFRAGIGARVTVRGLNSVEAVVEDLAEAWENL